MTLADSDPLGSNTAHRTVGIKPGVPPGLAASRRVTLLADRYTGRHIRQARHGAWVNKKRSRSKPSRQLLPAAAALTITGVLIGGAGATMQFGTVGQGSGAGVQLGYDAGDYPADRDALADRASRDESRVTAVAPTPGPMTKKSTQPAGNGTAISTGSCEASYYDEPQGTASGETFDPEAFTAAHNSLPFNSRVRVTNLASGTSVVVRINDRGPFVAGRCIDLSRAAFRAIASLGTGVIDVRYEVLAKDAT